MATAKQQEYDAEAGKEQLERDFAQVEIRKNNKQFNVVNVRDLGDVSTLSFDDAVALMGEAGISVDTASPELVAELTSDGFVKADKKDLLNKKVLFLTWSMDNGSRRLTEDGFLVVRALIAEDNKKVWFTCGGYGLAEELRTLTAQRIEHGSTTPNAGLVLPKGLDRSAPDQYPDSWIYRISV